MLVTKDEYNNRMNICRSCDKFNKTLNMCKVCNCIMTFKCGLSRTKCPIDKWGPSSSKEQVHPNDDIKIPKENIK
jgi:hypothetical protein